MELSQLLEDPVVIGGALAAVATLAGSVIALFGILGSNYISAHFNMRQKEFEANFRLKEAVWNKKKLVGDALVEAWSEADTLVSRLVHKQSMKRQYIDELNHLSAEIELLARKPIENENKLLEKRELGRFCEHQRQKLFTETEHLEDLLIQSQKIYTFAFAQYSLYCDNLDLLDRISNLFGELYYPEKAWQQVTWVEYVEHSEALNERGRIFLQELKIELSKL